jgi:cytochrome oxidase Cu insertion factor (SCO1/SenC/PrrC family)
MTKKIFFSLFLAVAVFGFWTCGDDCPTLTGQNKTDWQNALDNAQASIDSLVCQ